MFCLQKITQYGRRWRENVRGSGDANVARIKWDRWRSMLNIVKIHRNSFVDCDPSDEEMDDDDDSIQFPRNFTIYPPKRKVSSG